MDLTRPSPAGAALRDPARTQLLRLASLLQPKIAKLDSEFERGLKSYGPTERRALLAVTPGAAVRILGSRSPFAAFLEQVEYNGRRLAKLNVPPSEILRALRSYERLLARRAQREVTAFAAAQEQLHLATALALNNAFYQVREAETQAFYGLFHAELEAKGLEDLLKRFIAILTRTFRARAGRLWVFDPERPQIEAAILRRLSRPRYLTPANSAVLILDSAMRDRFASYWSIPLRSGDRVAGLMQFGFPGSYRWLPRELQLLDAVAERCLVAAEKARLVEDLAAREAQVRTLASHMLQVEEEERRRISRELHDETGQSMLTLRLELEMLERSAANGIRTKLAGARELVENSIVEVRRLISALSPAVLEQVGLPAAIRQLARRLRKSQTVQLRLQLENPRRRLPGEIETVAYRLVQESLQNIVKHAQATSVNLSLRSTDKQLELSIRDNGVGFDVGSAAGKPNSFGLSGMRERVALFGGSFRISSRPGRGTRIFISLPFADSSRRKVAHGQDSSISR